MLQCCSRPGDSCLPAASPCQRSAGASPPSAASFPEVGSLPPTGEQPPGSASPPRLPGLRAGISPGAERAASSGNDGPRPPPAPVPADSPAGSGRAGARSPQSALVLSPPRCHGLRSHIPCPMGRASPPPGAQPDSKPRTTSPGDSSGCRAHPI